MTAPLPRRRFWGWGVDGAGPAADQAVRMAANLAQRFGGSDTALVATPPPDVTEIQLAPPRVAAPASLARLFTDDPGQRLSHAQGKSFRDTVRAYRRRFDHPPDLVAYPETDADVAAILDWCASTGVAAIPYGGGSSVVGGVEADVGDSFTAAVSIDLARIAGIESVDRTSRTACIRAGTYGPALEDGLRPYGLTLRHFPQSFEFSTLGGWIATRSGGHYATNYTHIDDFVESLRTVTPAGIIESRRLPGSGAGPSPDRMIIGSEGILGVITEAHVRVQDRPAFRAAATARFPSFMAGSEAVREVGQAALFPANCRLLDPGEALQAGGSGADALLLLGFESADHPVDAWLARAIEICAAHGGTAEVRSPREGSAEEWRGSFLRAPYGRDALIAFGFVVDTFETSITWDRWPEFHDAVIAATTSALSGACGTGLVTCRFTHAYPDGPAPYYTFIAPSTLDRSLEAWTDVKGAASDTIIRSGGTITHHHAVGRDHRPWYERQRPDLFADALGAVKSVLDPAGILNPGVLLAAR